MLTLLEVIAGRPWAIRSDIALHVQGILQREGFAGLRQLAGLKRAVHAFDEDDRDDRPRERFMVRRIESDRGGSTVAVVPIIGTLTQRGDFINSAETRSSAAIGDEVSALATEAKVDSIVLDVDSPGGEVYGIPEAWAAIHAAAKVKPVVAAVNSQMASAALYLGSASTEIFVTPSGEAGSLGVYALHVDASKAIEEIGEKWEFVIADDSPFKVEGNFTEPLSDDARAQIKKAVNRYMSMFVRDVARGRKLSVDHVRENFGKGRMLGPQEAVAVKMADQVGTLQQAIRRAAALGKEWREKGGAPRAEVEPMPPVMEAPESPKAEEPTADRPAGLTPEQRAAMARLGAL